MIKQKIALITGITGQDGSIGVHRETHEHGIGVTQASGLASESTNDRHYP